MCVYSLIFKFQGDADCFKARVMLLMEGTAGRQEDLAEHCVCRHANIKS